MDFKTPDDNYGSDIEIHIKSDTQTRRAYLKFDLSVVPSGTLITSAKLYLYCTASKPTSPLQVDVNETGDSWNEGTITWSNAPAVGAFVASNTTVDGTGKYYSWDITSYTQSQFNGDKILSAVVKLPQDDPYSSNPNYHRDFASKEYTGTSYDPYLEITYTQQAPVAIFTYSPTSPYRYETITFDASDSYDPDGSIVSYKWDFGDGNVTTVTDPIITHFYERCGNHTLTLTVTDDEGLINSTSETITVINPDLLRIWADAGSYVGSHTDAWILEGWVVSNDVSPSSSVSFHLYIDAISSSDMKDPTYDVYLAIAVNDTAQIASITIGPTTITTFTHGEITWPEAAGGGTFPPHGVYPTWYALAPFGDVASNHGYYTAPSDPYGPYWAFRANISVTITTSATMNAGFKVHFDAQGTLARGSTDPRDRNSNPCSHDLTFEGALYLPEQYYLTMNTDPAGIVTIPGEGWYDNCTYVNLAAPEFVPNATGINGERHRFDHWTVNEEVFTTLNITVHMDANYSATAHYVKQFYLTLETNPVGVTTPSGVGWYDAQTYASISTPEIVSDDLCYEFTGWTTDDMTEITDPESPSTTVLIDKAKTVTANYVIQYSVTFSQLGVGTDFTGTVVTVDGIGFGVGDLSVSFWWDENSQHNFSFASPLVVNSGKRYIWDFTSGLSSLQSETLTITSSGNVTGHYKTQFKITFDQTGVGSDFTGPVVNIDGIGYDATQLPVSFWWDNCSLHTYDFKSPLVVTQNCKRYAWTSTSGLSALQSDSIHVSTSGNITGNYKTQYYLKVVSPYDSPGGEGWYDSSSTAYATLSTGILDHGNGTRRIFTHWSGDASGTDYAKSNPIHMDSCKTAIANWKTQYLLTVRTDPTGLSPQPTRNPAGEAGPPSSWWYDESTDVLLTAANKSYLGTVEYLFDYWEVDGPKVTGNPISVHMDKPHTATAHYKKPPPPTCVGGDIFLVKVDKPSICNPVELTSSLLAILAISLILIRRKKKGNKRSF